MLIRDTAPDLEQRRLAALWALDILDSLDEDGFNDLVAEVSETCNTPISLISLVDTDRQWFKARVGLEAQETPRDVASVTTPSRRRRCS